MQYSNFESRSCDHEISCIQTNLYILVKGCCIFSDSTIANAGVLNIRVRFKSLRDFLFV